MSDGILDNRRFLYKKASMLHTKKVAGVKRKMQQSCSRSLSVKVRLKEPDDAAWTDDLIRSLKSASGQEQLPQTSCVSGPGDSWEVDSGFSSETSPSASGRSSPCSGPSPSAVVALDCEMVGTGPGGCCSELARCSIVDYHGNVLYDKYVQPGQPVTDYRTPWSGIQRHHLLKATPFGQAREEVGGASRFHRLLVFRSLNFLLCSADSGYARRKGRHRPLRLQRLCSSGHQPPWSHGQGHRQLSPPQPAGGLVLQTLPQGSEQEAAEQEDPGEFHSSS